MGREPEHPVVEYRIAFTIPKEHVHQKPDERIQESLERTVQRMVMRLTDSYPYQYEFDPDDMYAVTVKVEAMDDPDGNSPTEKLDEALQVVARMLGQRCANPADGRHDELLIDLHSDLAALDLLNKHGWAEKWDTEGKVTGYLH